MSFYARVVGWGRYIPDRVLTNHQIAETLETTDDWIVSRTGIQERRIAADHETPSTMGVLASMDAMKHSGIGPEAIDLIIAATSSPDRHLPSCAALIQQGVRARAVPAFDVNAACSGFLYGLHIAQQFISTGACRTVLVTGTEVYSRMLNWSDPSTCVLFGDGAGAMILQASEEPTGILSCVAGNDASAAGLIEVPGISASPMDPLLNGGRYLTMDGGRVFRMAIRHIVDSTRHALCQAGLESADVDLFIPHQANLRIINHAAEAAAIPAEKVFVNVERYGNTAAASIPIAICEAVHAKRIHDGDHILLAGVGAGFSWASTVIKWG